MTSLSAMPQFADIDFSREITSRAHTKYTPLHACYLVHNNSWDNKKYYSI